MPWNVRPSPSRLRWNGLRASSFAPSSSTEPVARAYPVMASIKVVLPAPFGPIRPRISPGKTSKLTSSLAITPP